MIEMKLLIIIPKHAFEYKYIEAEEYNVLEPYIGNGRITRIIREIWFRLVIPGKSLWFNKNLLCNADDIIVYEPLIVPEFMRWLHNNNPQSNILLFYLNPVKDSVDPRLISNEWCRKGSPDKEDCEEYGLDCFSCGGYFSSMKVTKRESPEYDIVFVGRDKGRVNRLEALKNDFEKIGLKTYFHVSPDKRYELLKNRNYKPALNYEEVLDLVGNTRAILHLAQGSQNCVTFRVMESLFHEIKLITDQKELANETFYDPNNIFILGQNDIGLIKQFLLEPYHKVNDVLLDKYRFSDTIERYLLKRRLKDVNCDT